MDNFKQTNKSETAGESIIKITRITEQATSRAFNIELFFILLLWHPGESIVDLDLLYCLVQVLLIERQYRLSKCSDTWAVQKVHLQGTRCVVCFLYELCIHRAVTVIGNPDTFAIFAFHDNHNKSLLINLVSPGSVIY